MEIIHYRKGKVVIVLKKDSNEYILPDIVICHNYV